MEFDKYNTNKLAQILNIDKNFFKNKHFQTIAFEISNKQEEKINFYYRI